MYTAARKITNRGTRKNIGFFPSKKNERPIAFESLLELDYIHLLEFDSDVLKYWEQPETIAYSYSCKHYRYTPDFFVKRKSKTQLIEIKPKSNLEKILCDDFKSKKYLAAAHYCKSKGYSEFKIITDEEIRSGSMLKNIKYLFSYSGLDVPSLERMKIKKAIELTGSQQIAELLLTITDRNDQFSKYYSYILAMVYNQEIKTNMYTTVDKTSVLEI